MTSSTVNPMFAKFDQALGVTTPTGSSPVSTRADEIRALGKAGAPSDNPLMETTKNYAAAIKPAVQDVTGGGNIGGAASDFEKGDVSGGIEKGAVGTAADAVNAIFAPISAPIKTLLDHTAKANAANPGITDHIVNSPEAVAARKQMSDWATQHPDLAKALSDVFTVGTAAIGGEGAGNILNKPVSEIATGLKNTVTKTAETMSRYDVRLQPKPVIDETAGILPESGKMTPDDARASAWQDIQPHADDKTVEAYRSQGATNPKTLTKGVTLNPTKADQRVLEHLQPLYEDGTVNPKMTTEQKIGAIEGKSKETTLQSDNFIADNNKIVETPELTSALDKAKKGSGVVFGTDKTLEGAYDAVTNAFKGKLSSGTAGATGTDLVSIRKALKQFDAEMTDKFPNVYKTSPTGEINPTDNARLTAIRDVHSSVRDFIVNKLNETTGEGAQTVGGTAGDAYQALLDKNSGLIKAATMLNKGASNVSKIHDFVEFVKKHPYFLAAGGWEALKHTVAPGLPGI